MRQFFVPSPLFGFSKACTVFPMRPLELCTDNFSVIPTNLDHTASWFSEVVLDLLWTSPKMDKHIETPWEADGVKKKFQARLPEVAQASFHLCIINIFISVCMWLPLSVLFNAWLAPGWCQRTSPGFTQDLEEFLSASEFLWSLASVCCSTTQV